MPLDLSAPSPSIIKHELGAIFVSLELSRTLWVVTSLSPGGGEKMSRRQLPAGDATALLAAFAELQSKCLTRSGGEYSIVAIQEAGLDGFWLHRVLQERGVESHVVDPASIATSRRRRRAKTDNLDGEALLRALLAYKRGEPRVCAMVRAPDIDDEDQRQITRERRGLTAERVEHVNRIKGLLFAQGVGGCEPLRRDRRQRLETLRTGDGRLLPRHLKARIGRELDRLELILEQLREVEARRNELTASPAEPGRAGPALLQQLRGVGAEVATVLWTEGLFRTFNNRRQLASYAGLAPTPWQSGGVSKEQGVSKAGNARLRTTMVQMSWLWLRHQPQSALALWFQRRSSTAGGRNKRIMIIALARKLLLAVWRFANLGVVPEGAVLSAR